ncbi:hypothetical protein QUB12_05850 [Microcoleus sp. B7-D4]
MYFERGRWRFTVGWGRVYEIMGFRQLLLVKPAPTILDRSEVDGGLALGGGGFMKLWVLGNYCW